MVKVKQINHCSKKLKNGFKRCNHNGFKKKSILTMPMQQLQKVTLIAFQRIKKRITENSHSHDVPYLNGNNLITHCTVQNNKIEDHPISILITSVKDSNTIFARTQKCNEKYIKTINTIYEYGKKYAEHLKPISTLSNIVLVKYDNQNYGRAIIIELFAFIQKVNVFFIDFGDTKIVPIVDVKQLFNRKIQLLPVYILKMNLIWVDDNEMKLNTRKQYLMTLVGTVLKLKYDDFNGNNEYIGRIDDEEQNEYGSIKDKTKANIEFYHPSKNIYRIFNNQLNAFYSSKKCLKCNYLISRPCSGYFHLNTDGWTFSVRVLEENNKQKLIKVETSVTKLKKLKKSINNDDKWSLQDRSIVNIKEILGYSQKHKHILLMEFFSKIVCGKVKNNNNANVLQFLQLFSIKDIRKMSQMFYQLDSFSMINILCTLYGCISLNIYHAFALEDLDARNLMVEFICEILNIIKVQNIDKQFILISIGLCSELWHDCYLFVNGNETTSQHFNQIVDYIFKLNENQKYFSNHESLRRVLQGAADDNPNTLQEYAINQINTLKLNRYYIASEIYNRRKKASDIVDTRKFIGLNGGGSTSNLLEITSDTNVHDLKVKIYQRFKIPLRSQYLYTNKSVFMNDYDTTKVVSYFDSESDNKLFHLFVYKLPAYLKMSNINKKRNDTASSNSITVNVSNLYDKMINSLSLSNETLKWKCCVCLNLFERYTESIRLLNCFHNICKSCLKSLISESKDVKILCPSTDDYMCQEEISDQDIQMVCEGEEYDKFQSSGGSIIKQKTKNVYEELLLLDDSNIIKNTESFNCSLCFKDIPPGDGILLHDCLHSFCQLCLQGYIKNDVRSMITCPFADYTASAGKDVDCCNVPLQHREIKELCTSDEFNEFLNRSLQMLNNEHQYEALLSLDDAYFIENKEKFECAICLVEHDPGVGMMLRECLHTFCKQCLHDYISNNFESIIKCPFTDDKLNTCVGTLQHREIQALLTFDEFEKFLSSSITDAANKIGKVFYCIKPNCVGFGIIEDEIPEGSFICCVCELEQCMQCKVPMHMGITCQQYQDSIILDNNNERSEKQITDMINNQNAMICPNCKALIQKVSGCDGLTCTMCKIELCWATKGARWGKNGIGDTSGGCKCKLNYKKCHPSCENCH